MKEGAVGGFIQEALTGFKAGLKTGAKTKSWGTNPLSTGPCTHTVSVDTTEHAQTTPPLCSRQPQAPPRPSRAAPALLSSGTGRRCCRTGPGSREEAHA